jgi:hypothetical protein
MRRGRRRTLEEEETVGRYLANERANERKRGGGSGRAHLLGQRLLAVEADVATEIAVARALEDLMSARRGEGEEESEHSGRERQQCNDEHEGSDCSLPESHRQYRPTDDAAATATKIAESWNFPTNGKMFV